MTLSTELSPQLATACLGVGLVFSLVCYLTTNLSPGGMITPGWIALTLVEDYRHVGVIAVMTTLTFVLIKLLNKAIILYGKRLFAAVVLLSVILQLGLFLAVQREVPLLFPHQTLGFVAPGLIAYQLIRQPVRPTILATSVVALATFGVTVSGILAGLVPLT